MKHAYILGALAFTVSVGAASAQTVDQALIERGRYIATMGDCAACHTVPRGGGAAFAGGYPITSPLGTIWSTNITPSKTHGIGTYSEEDFAKAVRHGVLPDGTHLYPAMPYDAYAGVTDADMKALYAYFMNEVAPVDEAPAHVTALPFPFNLRFSMAAWNLLYARAKPFGAEAEHPEAVDRGQYIVDTLGHCASCHTARGLLMGPVSDGYLQGGQVGPWHAPDITGDRANGIGTWSNDEIVAYLKTGRAEGKAQAAGPMAEAVEHSLQHLSDADLAAVATYLKSVNASSGASGTLAASRTDYGAPVDIEPDVRGKFAENAHDSLTDGAALYSGYCASCHQPNGAGSENQAYPALFHNSVTGASDASNLIATILFGVDRETDGTHVLMPHFSTGSYVAVLTDQEVADIANFVLRTWGNTAAGMVTPADVATIRYGGPVAPLARLQPYIPGLMAAGVAIVLLALISLLLLRKRRRFA